MTKKLSAILIGLLSLFCAVGLSACSESCMSRLFTPSIPTEASVRKQVRHWEIELPEDYKILNYWINVGLGDGIWYYELEYDGSDDVFNSKLLYEKNKSIESLSNLKFEDKSSVNIRCTEDCAAPQITGTYGWLILYDRPYTDSHGETNYFSTFKIVYVIETERLIIYEVNI